MEMDEALNTVYALKMENLWSTSLRRDVVKQVIAGALRFERKFGTVLDDHRLLFRYMPAIWTPVFYLLADLDWVKLSFAPSDDVDLISFQTVCFDCWGYDLEPTELERCLGAVLPRKCEFKFVSVTENGPICNEFNFDQNPIIAVSKLTLDQAMECDFIGLISNKIQKRNILKWIIPLLQPEAVTIISIIYAAESKSSCCPKLQLPRVPANKKKQMDALMKCANCRQAWRQFDFHPRQALKLPESLLWDVCFCGLKTLVETKNDACPAFLNAPIQSKEGYISAAGSYEIITGKGIHSTFVFDADFNLVESTTRAGITLAKMTCVMRLISTVKLINGSVKIAPRTDFRDDAIEWLEMFAFRANVRASALLDAAAESIAPILRYMDRSNVDYHEHTMIFQRQYYLDFTFNYCPKCNDPSCKVNGALDRFIEKMGRLLAMKTERTVCLTDILGYEPVETFVKRNFDQWNKIRVWKSTDSSIFKETNGFEKSLLFGADSCKSVADQLKDLMKAEK